MTTPQVLSLALLLLFSGLILWLIVSLVIRFGGRRLVEAPRFTASEEAAGQDAQACIVLEPGGLLVEINPAARKLFDLPEDEVVTMEHLARRARPAEAFFAAFRQAVSPSARRARERKSAAVPPSTPQARAWQPRRAAKVTPP